MQREGQPDAGLKPQEPSAAGMRDHWREFARRDPMFYIATRDQPWTREEFFTGGRKLVDDILQWAGSGLRRERMLEVGCGMGRLLVHFASHFERVDGVDIASEMIDLARSSELPKNVHTYVSSGVDLALFDNHVFDFVFSFIVFHHIPDREVISSYLREVARVLKPDGTAALQFDTRRTTALTRVLFALPDFMLPRSRRRYIRRYRRKRADVLAMVDAAGLSVKDERGPNTAWNFLLLAPR